MNQSTVTTFPANPPNARYHDKQSRSSGWSLRSIQNTIIGFSVFLGGFVLFEPAPYELFLIAVLAIWVLLGLKIPGGLAPLILLFVIFNAGGFISAFQIEDYMRGVIYVATSLFLAFTSVFFACIITQDYRRLKLIFRAWVLAAVVTAIPGIIAYFGAPGMEMFLWSGRARGVFHDPNVLAPFLVGPMLYLIHGMLNSNLSGFVVRGLFFAIILFAQLLAFSRAGWGMAFAAIATYGIVIYLKESDPRMRLRYVAMALTGLIAVAGLVLFAMQIETVSTLLSERAKLIQPYDDGELGRFARHALGLEASMEHPFGFAPLEFGHLYGEHIHNSFLKASLAYGWIGFVSWFLIVISTLLAGARLLFRTRPWQVFFQISYIIFFWHIVISYIIDIDHWRHFYLLIGIIWGCFILERRWVASPQPKADR